jgi:glycosyltransferase involved in cell wall biosynthesis
LATPGGPERRPRVAFVYPNPRRELVAEVVQGRAPDTTLLGQNHLAELGLDATVEDVEARGRLSWNLREPAIAWRLASRADVVFTPLAALLPLAARARGRPSVVVVNYGLCTIWERSGRPRRRLLRASLGSADRIVCLGFPQRDLLLRQTELPPERVVTVRLGVDERFFGPQPQAEGGEPLVVSVGKDLARDYATFAEAVALLGVRAEIACLPRNLEGVTLPPRVRAGFVGAAELRALYGRAACVVVPQRRLEYPYGSEGGGLTALLEAMASARAVVASARPILADYVSSGEDALLVPPEDPAALASAISRVLEDRRLAASLGAAARRRVDEGLTTRHFAEGIAPILQAAAVSRLSGRQKFRTIQS